MKQTKTYRPRYELSCLSARDFTRLFEGMLDFDSNCHVRKTKEGRLKSKERCHRQSLLSVELWYLLRGPQAVELVEAMLFDGDAVVVGNIMRKIYAGFLRCYKPE